jgi:hypothetical protein
VTDATKTLPATPATLSCQAHHLMASMLGRTAHVQHCMIRLDLCQVSRNHLVTRPDHMASGCVSACHATRRHLLRAVELLIIQHASEGEEVELFQLCV